jgi:hypothetical protein
MASPSDQAGSLQFPVQLSIHSVPLTPEDSSTLPYPGVRSIFHGLRPYVPVSTPSFSHYDAAGFTSCYGLHGCDDIASTLGLLLTLDGHYEAA